jgi:nucleoside-diphosphate-sugar epimerase
MPEPTTNDQGDVAIVGCGYVGTALGRRLRAEPDVGSVIATTRSSARATELSGLGLVPRIAELARPETLHAALRTAHVVYFTAAAGREAGYAAVYHAGLQHLLRACSGTPVRRIIYTSSTAVYGQRDGGWVDEDAHVAPPHERGRVLADAERLLLREAPPRGITATVLRLAGIHGPGRGPQNVASRLAGSTRTDGDAYLNLVHVDVIVEALVRLRKLNHTGILNLADGNPQTRREFYDPLLAARGLDPIRWSAPEVDSADRGRRVCARRIQELLDLDLDPG